MPIEDLISRKSMRIYQKKQAQLMWELIETQAHGSQYMEASFEFYSSPTYFSIYHKSGDRDWETQQAEFTALQDFVSIMGNVMDVSEYKDSRFLGNGDNASDFYTSYIYRFKWKNPVESVEAAD